MKNINQGRYSRNCKRDEDQYKDEVEEIKRQICHLNTLLNHKNRCLAEKMNLIPNNSNKAVKKSCIKENRVRAYSNQTTMNRDSSLDCVIPKQELHREKNVRKKSVVFMRENRPIFQKLAPVVCKEDDQQDFYVNSVGVYHKSEYVMDKPYNRQALKGNIKQISNEGLTSAESTTPKKWNSALKKVKCETLGFYLDRATSLLAKNSNLNSGPSSNFSSFKDPSFITMSCERKESKKHHPRVSMMDNKGSVLSAPKQHVTRKSMVCLTPNHIKGNKSQYEKKILKSFDTTPYKTTNNYYMNKDTRNTSGKLDNAQITVEKLEETEGSVNKEASDLKEFIEIEDFCRRTTVADSKFSCVDEISTQKKAKINKKNSRVANKHKYIKTKKVIKNPPSLIKTFAITISNDNIIYS